VCSSDLVTGRHYLEGDTGPDGIVEELRSLFEDNGREYVGSG